MVFDWVRTACYPTIYGSASQARSYFYNLVKKGTNFSNLWYQRIKKISSPKMRNREFVFAPKIQYKLVDERSEANPSNLQFPTWCRIIKIVRTAFATCG